MGDRDKSRRPQGELASVPTPAEVVGGKHTVPPGYDGVPGSQHGTKRAYVNPYIDRLDDYPELILDGPAAERLRGRWRERWAVQPGVDRPFLGMEVGSGNGFFLRDLCLRHPERRYVGLEIRYKRVWLAANKLAEAGCTNGAVVLFHAGYLARLFAPGELDAIHLNHPDPWPKNRHARNRLIAPGFVSAVAELLAPGGALEVKSDCARYADELRRCAADQPLEIEAFTADLHRPGEPLAADNILTNYERKFIAKGEPVFYMRLRHS
jgi:tRNA (guanine-N7-)-methyltransferase